MSENDWDGWKKLTEHIGDRCQLVGDNLFVTNDNQLLRIEEELKGLAVYGYKRIG